MLEDEVPQKRRSTLQRAVRKALLTPMSLTKQGAIKSLKAYLQ